MQTKIKPELEDLLTVNRTCEILAISRVTFYRLIRRGELKIIKVGDRTRVNPDDLRRYIKKNAA